MAAGRKWFVGGKKWENTGECNSSIFDLDDRFAVGLEFAGGENCARLALFGQAEKLFVFSERQIAGIGVVGLGKAGESNPAVADNVSFDVLGDFAGGKIHGLTDVAFLFDGVVFAEDNDTGLVGWADLFVKHSKRHDRQTVACLAKVRGGSV